jgi:alpha-L-rhamnosidase
LSWKIETDDENAYNVKQEAYQVLVASSVEKLSEDKADLWNSGKLESDQNSHIIYQGKNLKSQQKYYWKVAVWDSGGKKSYWSEVASWRMVMFNKYDWQAKWIGDQPDMQQKSYSETLINHDAKNNKILKNIRPEVPPTPLLRKSFKVRSAVKDAFLAASALGYYEVNLNGSKIGDQVLAPEWTDYNKRVQYQVFEIGKQLKKGDNVLSSVLGDGWYLGMLGPTKWHQDYPLRGAYGNDRRFLAQLTINYVDGSTDIIETDGSWKILADGYIPSADNFLGQKIDASKIPKGWKEIEFDDSTWKNAFVDQNLRKNLVAQKNEPIRIYDTLQAQSIKRLDDKFIVDFGQNLTGWTSLKIKGKKGDQIKIRHGEMLYENGSLYTENLTAAIQEDDYILSGEQDIFEPSFTYHGFRYIEVSGLTNSLEKDMIEAYAISSDPDISGSFECSNEKLNKLFSNILWTQRNNMTSVPTDCPQRDERMGWMGDAQIFCQTSIFNMDMAAFYNKWLIDIRDAQALRGAFPDFAPHGNKPDIRFSNAPGWSDAGIIIPWQVYQNYGDKQVLEDHYMAMFHYIRNLVKKNPDHLWVNDVGNMYGDWLNANTIIADGYSNTRGEVPKEVFATAYYANSMRLFSEISTVLGKDRDAEISLELFAKIKAKFNEAYVAEDGRIKGNTQSTYALALHFDLLPEEKQKQAFAYLLECIEEYDYRISTGFVTTIMMMKELTKRGRNDIAYTLLESERFPSWIYSINQGATSIWERWDGYVKGRGFQNAGMNSFNHYSIGAVGEWMYRVILGINPSEKHPGFKHFVIHPQPGGTLTWAKGTHNSINGLIASDWKMEKDLFTLHIEIPVNTTATVMLPTKDLAMVKMNTKAIPLSLISDQPIKEKIALELGSGKYHFIVQQK